MRTFIINSQNKRNMEKNFSIGFAQADHNFGIPAENIHVPESIQHTMDGCNFHSEATILNEYGFNVTEEQLQSEGQAQGWYHPGQGTPIECMGRHIEGRGIPVSMTEGNGIDNLISELSQDHRVIVAVDSGELWNPNITEYIQDQMYGGNPDHALIVDGISIKDNLITLTDSGSGDYRTEFPLDNFMDAWNDSNCTMVATQVSPQEFMSLNEDIA